MSACTNFDYMNLLYQGIVGNAWPSIYVRMHFLQTVSESMLSLHAGVHMSVQHSKHGVLIPLETPGI
jgi:hypothetical protein